jgi:hypothetical protein
VSLDLQDLPDRQGLLDLRGQPDPLDLRGQRDQPEVLRHLLRDRRSSLPSSHQTELSAFLRVSMPEQAARDSGMMPPTHSRVVD